MNRLPSSFTSLYRLVLRASSASVLHQNTARKQLRRLFRPVFDATTQVIADLQSDQLSSSERARREQYLDAFQQRMDGTLNLLLNSAQHRGVPHRVIYNVARLRRSHALWVHGKCTKGAWNPKLAVANASKAHLSPSPRDIARMQKNRIHEHCWDALGEVVRMAEGRQRLSLGRVHMKPWTLERR